MIDRKDSLEEKITNMLEKVLRDDSDEEETNNTNFQKDYIKRKDSRSHTFNVIERNKSDKNGQCSESIYFSNNNTLETPRLFVNNIPYSQEEKENKSNLINNVSNSNLGINFSKIIEYSRISNRSKNINKNYGVELSQKSYQNAENLENMISINVDNYNSHSTTSSLTHNHLNSNDQKKKTIVETNPALFSYNEFDEILEGRIRQFEAIDIVSYETLKGNFLKVIKSQNGSRILQSSLKNSPDDLLSKIYEEICCKVNELMVDPYANYFCQKFFIVLSNIDRIKFLIEIKDHFIEIGNSKIGTYPLQAIIDNLKTNEEKTIVIEAIKDDLMTMCVDPQGCHVVEKIVNCFEEDLIKYIYQNVIDNFMMLANNANGLCVVKKIIIHAQDIKTLNQVRTIVGENTLSLVQNAYGNYALQIAFENWSIEFCSPITINFKDNFYKLSLQKYSSNVIEKCFEKGDETALHNFAEEICVQSKIIDLMKNSYGNYVVQKALKLSSGQTKIKILNCIKKNLDKLMDKKLIAKWKAILNNSIHLSTGNIDFNFSSPNMSACSHNSSYSNRSANQLYSPHHSPTSFYANKLSKSPLGSPQSYNPTFNKNFLIHRFPQQMSQVNFPHSPQYTTKKLNY